MFVGRWEAKKNILRLIEAFGEFKKKFPQDHHKLVLVGPRGFGYEAAEMAMDQYGIRETVIELNYLASDDVALLYSGATALVFPSLYEGFGLPVIEAMACGCPVVCSNTTNFPEVAGDAAIKFNPEKVELITKAMETVAFNEDIRQGLIAAGLEQCQKFSWERCAVETLRVVKGSD
jgi:glycosyltransferase involved in cell wall biosynthesis